MKTLGALIALFEMQNKKLAQKKNNFFSSDG